MNKKKLEIYGLKTNEDNLGVDIVSLVLDPAIDRNFFAFNKLDVPKKYQFKIENEEKREILGPAMVPDLAILRKVDDEYFYVTFSEDEIRKNAISFAENGFHMNANLDHEFKVKGIIFYQSYIVDREKNLFPPIGSEDLPNGTWILGAKINNDEVWNQIREGKIKGFSIEGYFEYISTNENIIIEDEIPSTYDLLSQIRDVYHSIIKELDNERKLDK